MYVPESGQEYPPDRLDRELRGIADQVNGMAGGVDNVADGGTIRHGYRDAPGWVNCTASVSGEFVSVTAINAYTFTVAIKKHDNTAGTQQNVYWLAGVN